ncbi:polysaccharide biosynthesis protein [Lacrimispora sp. NSJ-141]|uniref:Polysaccharide biosynthesis protein n=1 Tax=Lientehia hominis TaxID=2897778 RepID=A0AAP2RIE1_9FIRM|nr:polysaccharide biosynthesis protein [Lientehia hominis]MCD2492276.1 polysaccharide biosynthesis protein [Lientehia hominis]
MMKSRIVNSSRNALWGVFNKFTTILFPFVTRTIIIYVLGAEYIGLDSLFVSIFQMLNLMEVGFGSAMVFNMYKPIAERDEDTICALLKFYKKVYMVIGYVVLFIGIVAMFLLPYLINGTVPSGININLLYVLYLLNTVFGYFFYAYRASILTAHQQDYIGGRISSVLHLVIYTLQIISLLIFKNYYIYILFLPIFSVLFNLLRNRKVSKLYPQYVARGKIKEDLIKGTKKNIIGLVGFRLEGYALNSVDNIILSSFLGLTSLAYFANYYYIISALTGILTVCYNAMTASIGNSLCTESAEKNIRDFHFLTFLNTWLVGWCSVCLICLYQHFIVIWVGNEYLLSLTSVILFVLYFMVNHLRRIVTTYRDAAGLWWSDKIRPYLVVILNIVLDIIFVQVWGINGILTSTVFLSAFISIPWELHILFKNIFIKEQKIDYYILLFKYLLEIALGGVVSYLICVSVGTDSIRTFIIKIIVCCLVPNLVFVLLNLRNKNMIRAYETIRQMIRRDNQNERD